MPYHITLEEIKPLTETVFQMRTTRPDGYSFAPGQYAELAVDQPGFREEFRPFSFTSRPQDRELEFVFRVHHAHGGVTAQLAQVKPGTALLIENPGGTITYQGPGCFVAGGTGITPFLSIFRTHRDDGDFDRNLLLFANKTERSGFLTDELVGLFGNRAHLVVTHEPASHGESGFIDLEYLRPFATAAERFYVCGPDEMVKEVCSALLTLQVKPQKIVVEH